MRVPIIDKDKNIIKWLDVKECDDVGVIHMGSGMARRTFRYNGKVSLPSLGEENGAAFEEVKTKTILDPTVQLAVDDTIPPLEIVLPPGQRLLVTLRDADGKFIVSYDHQGNQLLTVWSDMPGNVCGDDGIIYMEDFGKVDPRVAAKAASAEPPLEPAG